MQMRNSQNSSCRSPKEGASKNDGFVGFIIIRGSVIGCLLVLFKLPTGGESSIRVVRMGDHYNNGNHYQVTYGFRVDSEQSNSFDNASLLRIPSFSGGFKDRKSKGNHPSSGPV